MVENRSIETNTTDTYNGDYRNTVVVFYSGFLPPLVVLGFIFNSISLAILSRNSTRIPSIVHLLGICVSDMFLIPKIGLYAIMINLRLYYFDPILEWYIEKFNQIYPFMDHAFLFWMIYCTLLIAVERAFAVNKPLTVHIVWTKSRSIKAVVVVYILGVLVGVTVVVKNEILASDKSGTSSEWVWIYDICIIAVMRILPVSVLFVCNVIIWRGFKRNASNIALVNTKDDINPASMQSSRRENLHRLTKTLFIATLMLTLCLVPGSVITIVCWDQQRKDGPYYYEAKERARSRLHGDCFHRIFTLLHQCLHIHYRK